MQAVLRRTFSKRTPINGPKQANEGFPNVSEAIVKKSELFTSSIRISIIYLKELITTVTWITAEKTYVTIFLYFTAKIPN